MVPVSCIGEGWALENVIRMLKREKSPVNETERDRLHMKVVAWFGKSKSMPKDFHFAIHEVASGGGVEVVPSHHHMDDRGGVLSKGKVGRFVPCKERSRKDAEF